MKIDTPQIEKTIELEHATDTTIARSSAGQVTVEGAPVVIEGYTTTATAAGTTTLTVASTRQQYFTGTNTQTVTLPVTSTLVLGQTFLVRNLSTGIVTVNSSGANVVLAIPSLTTAIFTCILTSGTTAASWSVSSYLNTPAAAGASALTIFPKPNIPIYSMTDRNYNSNTTLQVIQVVVPFAITVNKISIGVSTAGVTGTLILALFSENGQTRLFSVTTASISGVATVETAVSAVAVPAGVYYMAVLPVSTAQITARAYNLFDGSAEATMNIIASDPVIAGSITVTDSTMPATITIASLTGGTAAGLKVRLDN